ncbi:MAG: hypothetical protein H7067_09655 [Burkholderiales bacterium]|nr:hypothetical protein [Opitutaceae bacterium]
MKTAFFSLLLGATAAVGQVVQWMPGDGGNGHYYELVTAPGSITWEDADAAAQGAGGYLATLTSASENAFGYTLASATASAWFIDASGNGLGPWLGGIQTTFTAEPAGGWTWVTGESWSYTNWASGEPSNFSGVEDRLQFFGSQTLMAATWNDLTSTGNAPDTPARSYLIEYNTAPIPEPSAYAVGIGAIALGFVLSRRRRTEPKTSYL